MASSLPGATVDKTRADQGNLASDEPTDLPILVPPEIVHPLPVRPAISISPSNVVLNGNQRETTPVQAETKECRDDRHSHESVDSWDLHDSRERKRHESVELIDSWVAPDNDLRPPKRMKVRDVEEWDTWIAPDLREEEETVERRAKSRSKRKGRHGRRGGKRLKRNVESFDSWVAEPSRSHVEHNDSDTESRGSRQLRDRSSQRSRRPSGGSNGSDGHIERRDRDIPPHLNKGRDLSQNILRGGASISRLGKDRDSPPNLFRGRDIPPHMSKETPRLPRKRDTPPHIRR